MQQKNLPTIAKDVLATVAYYDGLEYPLTAFEIWKYLMRADYCETEYGQPQTVRLNEILLALENEKVREFVEKKNGFYFLKGREELVEEKIERGKISAIKIKKLQKVVWWLRFVPFVRMVGVTGTLSMKNAEAKSDWDVLIVLEKDHIWTGRTLVTIFLQLFGKRRYDKKTTDRVCLNYYLTTKSLEIVTKDLFSASEYFFLFPLFGEKTYRSFQLRNQWIRKIKPQYTAAEILPLQLLAETKISQKIQKAGEFCLQSLKLERWLEKLEKNRILKNPKTYQEGSMIRFSDEALIFLPSPHGPSLFEKFKEKIAQFPF